MADAKAVWDNNGMQKPTPRAVRHWVIDHLLWDATATPREHFWTWFCHNCLPAGVGAVLLTWGGWVLSLPWPELSLIALATFVLLLLVVALIQHIFFRRNQQLASASDYPTAPMHASAPTGGTSGSRVLDAMVIDARNAYGLLPFDQRQALKIIYDQPGLSFADVS